ncbi:alpha/beta fold hydrolase [Parahaliea maris]|uniref:Alpha/beta fold hydrolase n=1 Tax=Parahaliea maris TaxID=2716870 RepID=A0A5C8ZPP7_9GAMM|nr:alpha/beta fold hydrolase [Parahaliea maris]TXS89507.1 alpha/beta fold hydrolase [Parahaliea maris]
MSDARKSYKYTRTPHLVVYEDKSNFKDTYAGEIDVVAIQCHLLRPEGKDSDTLVVWSHPIGGGFYLPMMAALAKSGVHTMYCDTRYRGVDTALIMEKVVCDLGAAIRDAKERFGYKKIILGGWSGGGSMSLFYQAEAENPTVTSTPAGDTPDLTKRNFIPADGMMLVAAHLARHRTLTEWLDPSVIDENDPENRDPELDIYNPDNPNQPPYSAEFLERFRAAQIERNRRITRWVKEKLAEYKANGQPNREFGFVVHRTMAEPKWLDPTIDPNDRKPNWCFLGEPEVVNDSPVGLARFCSLRSWLSQWSWDDANADGLSCAARTSVPTLVIGNTGDDGITPEHTQGLYDAVPHDNKELLWIEGANHYYFGQADKAKEAADACAEWLERQELA